MKKLLQQCLGSDVKLIEPADVIVDLSLDNFQPASVREAATATEYVSLAVPMFFS